MSARAGVCVQMVVVKQCQGRSEGAVEHSNEARRTRRKACGDSQAHPQHVHTAPAEKAALVSPAAQAAALHRCKHREGTGRRSGDPQQAPSPGHRSKRRLTGTHVKQQTGSYTPQKGHKQNKDTQNHHRRFLLETVTC